MQFTEVISAEFISQVGFPIAAFCMMLLLYLHATKISQQNIERGDVRYEMLVDKLLEKIDGVFNTNTSTMSNLSSYVRENTYHIKMVEDRQGKCSDKYATLVDRLITQLRNMSEQNKDSIHDLSTSIEKLTAQNEEIIKIIRDKMNI